MGLELGFEFGHIGLEFGYIGLGSEVIVHASSLARRSSGVKGELVIAGGLLELEGTGWRGAVSMRLRLEEQYPCPSKA